MSNSWLAGQIFGGASKDVARDIALGGLGSWARGEAAGASLPPTIFLFFFAFCLSFIGCLLVVYGL